MPLSAPRHHAAIAADPDGQVVLAIAHRGAGGTPELDEVKVLLVRGGADGVAEVYRDLRQHGFTNVPGRPLPAGAAGGDARQRAIRRVLASIVAER